VGLVPAKELVSDALLRRAETMRLEPKGSTAIVRLFIDGVAYPGGRIAKQEAHAVTQLLKLLSGLDVKQRKKRQSGGLKAEFSQTPYELLIVSEPTPTGVERLTVRARNLKLNINTPDDLGFSEEMKSKLREMSTRRSGAVLACGPPGSGTTTTRFALGRSVDAYQFGIYTICDLENRELPYTTVFELRPDDDLRATLERIIRMDADVVIAEPIPDAETAKVIFWAQEKITIISEFVARDVTHGLLQLLKWVGDPQVVAGGLRAIVSQKLMRLLCDDCKQAFRPNPKLLEKVGLPPQNKVLYRPGQPDPEDPEDEPCYTCGGLGYFGRVGMFEMLEMTEGMREVVLQGADPAAIKAHMHKEKMQTLQSEGLRLVADGKTSLEELQRVFKDRKGKTTPRK
jgi:type IV pilus assembly protein PilB